MDYAIQKFIEQEGKNYWYSEKLYQASATSGALEIASKDLNALGAVMILIHDINLSITNKAVVMGTIVDQFNRVILRFNLSDTFNGQYIVNYLVKGAELKLICNDPVVKFTVGYQYLRVVDSKLKTFGHV